MTKTNPLDRLMSAKAQADSANQDRLNYQKTIDFFRSVQEFSESEITDYSEKIRVLMGKDDSAALALFPDGLYQTAEQARQGARDYWSKVAA